MPTLTEYAALIGWPVDGLELRAGQGSDVVIDSAAGLVWRFPRTQVAREHMAGDRRRLLRVRALGLPAPDVLGGDLAGPRGRAHLLLRLVPGVPLHNASPALDQAAAAHLTDDLAKLLLRLRQAPLEGWPPAAGWVAQWSELAAHTEALLVPRLTPASADRARGELAAAVVAAREAQVVLVMAISAVRTCGSIRSAGDFAASSTGTVQRPATLPSISRRCGPR